MIASFAKIWRLLDTRDRLRGVLLVVLFLLNGLAETLSIGLIIPFLALIGSGIETNPWLSMVFRLSGADSERTFILMAVAGLSAIFVARSLFLLFVQYYQYKVIWAMRTAMASRFFAAYVTMPYEYHVRQGTAVIVRNVTQLIAEIFAGAITPAVLLAGETVMVLAIGTLLLVTDWRLCLAMGGAGLVLIVGMQAVVARRLKRWGSVSTHTGLSSLRVVTQTLAGIKEVKVLNREPLFCRQFLRETDLNSTTKTLINVVSQLPRMTLETSVFLAVFGAVAWVVAEGRPVVDILPTLGVFGVAAFRLLPSFNRISQQMQNLHFSQTAVTTLVEDAVLFEQTRAAGWDEGGGAAFTFAKDIAFRDVTFSYRDAGRQAVTAIDLTIARGQSVAFVGASGSGKSTLVNLLLGLYAPTYGRVEVDGRSISEDLRGWRANVGVIPQDVFLLDDTLRRNITFGLEMGEADHARMEAATKAAQLDGLLARLPDGLDTRVGERGAMLSGGERQRVGIARALYNQAQVLVMDEATSALDVETESAIAQSFEALRGERTLVIVAHRLSTIRHCDRIFFMEDGHIIASGDFDTLEATVPAFANLVKKSRLGFGNF